MDGIRGGVSGGWVVTGLAVAMTLALSAHLDSGERSARAQPVEGFEVVGQTGGVTRAVATWQTEWSDLALLGVGPRVLVLDLCDPSAPRVVGRSPILPGVVHDVDVQGRFAWVALGNRGVMTLDLANLRSPLPVDRIELPGLVEDLPGEAHRLDAEGFYAWVVGSAGVHVLDAYSPSELRIVDHAAGPADGFPGLARDVAASGVTSALVAWDGSGARTLAVRSGGIVEEGAYAPSGIVALAVAVANDDPGTAFVADGTGIVALEIGAEGELSAISSWSIGSTERESARALAAHDDRLIAGVEGPGLPSRLIAYGVSDPDSPRVEGSLELADYGGALDDGTIADGPWDVAFDRGMILAAVDKLGLNMLDRAAITEPSPDLVRVRPVPPVYDVASGGGAVWMSTGAPGIYRLTGDERYDPPPIIDPISGSIEAGQVASLSAGERWLAGSAGELRIWPTDLSEVARGVPDLDAVGDIDVHEDLLVAADGARGLVTVDAASAQVRGQLAITDSFGGLAILEAVAQDGTLGAAVDGSTLYSVDLTDPGRPVPIGATESLGANRDVLITDGMALIAADFAGARLFDLRTGGAPSLIADGATASGARAVATASGNIVWVATGTSGIEAWSIVRRTGMVPLLTLPLAGVAVGVAAEDDRVHVSAGPAGMVVLSTSAPPPMNLPGPSTCREPTLYIPTLGRE